MVGLTYKLAKCLQESQQPPREKVIAALVALDELGRSLKKKDNSAAKMLNKLVSDWCWQVIKEWEK
jgi:hypothetical protein